MIKTTDIEYNWIDSFRKGEDKALAHFFNIHYKSLCYFAGRLVQDDAEAEDIVSRCFVKLWKSEHEIKSEETINRNGMGFRPCHARMGTSMATFAEKNGFLSGKQVAYWRKRDKSGNMRIGIYWRQLMEAAQKKAAV